MFCGYAAEGEDIPLLFTTDEAGVPTAPDAAPTFRVFGRDGAVASGTGTATPAETGAITGATNASPIEVTSAAHGLPTGARVVVSGVGGNTAANGTFFVTATGANTFTLTGSAGDGAYTSGGSWRTLGLWRATLTGAVLSAMEAGRAYQVLVAWAVSAAARVRILSFNVQ
jgi:hypothetical protein